MSPDPRSEPPPRKKAVADPAAYGMATNIDRRTCTRVVPMKVLALGPSRTGTSSLRQALIDLGYSECYHFASLLQENPRDSEMWNEAMEAKFRGKGQPFTRQDWDQLLGHCMAVSDTPCAVFYRELLAAYPDAKVVLTVRDSPQQWWESHMKTILPFFDRAVSPPNTLAGWGRRLFAPDQGSLGRLNGYLLEYYEMYRVLWGDWKSGTREGQRWYAEYLAEVRRLVPPERLLVMNVKEGWEPLCEFLGEEKPLWDFPKINTRQDWESNVGALCEGLDRMVWLNAAKAVGIVAGLGAVAAGFWLRRSK